MENKAITEVDWKQEIVSWERSGLSPKIYCHQRQLHYHRFLNEKNRLRPKQAEAGKFLPIKAVVPESSGSTIKNRGSDCPAHWILSSPSGYQLSVPMQSDVHILNRLLDFMGEN